MEGTWEDERWSEKGEGVSLTELIFDSLNILKAVCHTCRENLQVSPVHMCQVPAFYIKILYSTGGNLQSIPGDNLSCKSEKNRLLQSLLLLTIKTALRNMAIQFVSHKVYFAFKLSSQKKHRNASSNQENCSQTSWQCSKQSYCFCHYQQIGFLEVDLMLDPDLLSRQAIPRLQ